MNRFFLSIFILFSCYLNGMAAPYQEILDLFGVEAEQVQDLWMQKGKERWQFDKRYEFMRPEAWPLFERGGLILEKTPEKARYDYAIVYGALLSTVETRIAYLAHLFKKGVRFNQIVFLTGERDLLDWEKQLCGLHSESEMVQWAYLKSELPKDVQVLIINAPKQKRDGVWSRPRTIDTVVAWMEKNPSPGTCLGVSNQPYVQYQDAVMRSFLPEGFEIETVGPAIEGEPTVALILDTIAKHLIYLK